MVLRHVDEPYRRVDVSQTRSEPGRAEFRKLNPIGKIPTVLLDDGDVLSESNAILYHFSRDDALWPMAAREQTEVLRWLFFEQYSHEPSVSVIRYLRHYTDNPQNHMEKIQALKPKAEHTLEVMEHQLQRWKWMAGQNCSIADYALYPYTRVANEAGFELHGLPSIERWLSQVEERPRFIPMGTEGAVQTLSFAEYFLNGA